MCEYFSANGHIVLRRVSSPRTKLLAARCEWCMSTFIQSQC
jgi:hypothetical protein